MKKLFGPINTLGIEIAGTAVRMVEVSRRKQRLEILTAVKQPFSPPVGEAYTDAYYDALEATIEKCLSSVRKKVKRAVLAFPSRNLISRQIRMPHMPEEELRASLRWELEKYVPLSADDYVYDYLHQGFIDVEGDRMAQLLLVAIPREEVVRHFECLKGAGLTVTAVETSSFALNRLLNVVRENDLRTYGCLDMGNDRSTFTVFREGKVQFIRFIQLGAARLEESLGQTFPVETFQLRQMIAEAAVTAEARETDESDGVTVNSQAVQMQFLLQSFFSDLLVEVRRSLDFYNLQYRDSSFSHLVLCGGLSRLRGIDAYFTQEFKLPVSVVDMQTSLVAQIKPDCLELLTPDMAVVTGLALRSDD
ncbi:type IV pilus assembly protein PilM [Heliobacterium undosum]|uniref:Type IV pilus assembly protein PilM n=1 Tax=Heliomicrobium undosum TaxID=121734 RepID=A0A845KXT2_9FIRM|nr:type IV pilus assembly protein PilM [Heliomicrobium undosum]MZP28487.1 type IV pilus assembly protein PilM [Heliomicrobium undosum]